MFLLKFKTFIKVLNITAKTTDAIYISGLNQVYWNVWNCGDLHARWNDISKPTTILSVLIHGNRKQLKLEQLGGTI